MFIGVSRAAAVDYTESSAALWGWGEEPGWNASVTLSNDAAVKATGANSLRVNNVGSGGDFWLTYPQTKNSHWNLTNASVFNFRLKPINNGFGWQAFSVRLVNAHTGQSIEYKPNNLGILPLTGPFKQFKVPLAGDSVWQKVSSSAGLGHIDYVEIHFDTWETGFTLWLDDVRFQNTPPLVGDTDAPTLQVHAPVNGAVVTGNLAFRVHAEDDRGVSSVIFSVDGSPKLTDTAPPYVYTWNVAGYGDGPHQIRAQASDAAGNAALALVNVVLDRSSALRDNTLVNQNVTYAPGVTYAQDPGNDGVLIVNADNIVIDGGGRVLESSVGPLLSDRSGYGIRLNGRRNVTIRNFKIRGFRYGIYATNSSHITVEDCDLSHNYNDAEVANWGKNAGWRSTAGRPSPPERGWLYHGDALALGGGLKFEGVTDSVIQRTSATHQAIGLYLETSDRNQIIACQASTVTAWGLYMFNSKYNTITRNRFSNVWRDGNMDAAGMLMEYHSDHNSVTLNELRDSSDGYFARNNVGEPDLARGHPLPETNNFNYVAYNDGSGAAANAFEATFSSGNVFVGNVASDSRYGFWLGFSESVILRSNLVRNNSEDGIAIEHGRNSLIEDNQISGNAGAGLHLWGERANFRSEGYTVQANQVAGNNVGFRLRDAHGNVFTHNDFTNNQSAVLFSADQTGSADNTLTQNDFSVPAGRHAVVNEMAAGWNVLAAYNWWGVTNDAAIQALISDAQDNAAHGAVNAIPWLAGPSGEGDATKPFVNIVSPMDGGQIFGFTIVRAEVRDDVGVTQVQLWVDGQFVGNMDGPDPDYTYAWSADGLAAGSNHALTVKARDAAGNEGSGTVNVTIPSPDVVVTHISRDPQYPNPKLNDNNRPRPGDVLTWKAHLTNNGAAPTGSFTYRWLVDGVPAGNGTVPSMPPGAKTQVSLAWTVPSGYSAADPSRHVIRFEAQANEAKTANNSRSAFMDGLPILLLVNQNTYGQYTDSAATFEERIQHTIDRCHTYYQNAVFPDVAPQGILERFRVDQIILYAGNAPPSVMDNHPDHALSIVIHEGGPHAGYLAYPSYRIGHNYKSGADGLFSDIGEKALIHEMGHYRQVVDFYIFDINEADNAAAPGQGHVNSMSMDLMSYHWNETGFFRYSARIMNAYLGQPRPPVAEWVDRVVDGQVQNGYILHDIPADNVLRILSPGGGRVAGAQVRVYRSTPDRKIPAAPLLSGVTNAEGEFNLGQPVNQSYSNNVFFIVLTHQGVTEYKWMETFDFNWAYWAGQTQTAVHSLSTQLGGTPLAGTGLWGVYFDNANLTGASVARLDPVIDFNWTNRPHPSIGHDTFSARWAGRIRPERSEWHNFYVNSNDGVRLWVNGQLLINNWTSHNAKEDSASIQLTANQMYDIKIEYYDNWNVGVMQLSWSSPSLAKQIIPTARLFPAEGAALSAVQALQPGHLALEKFLSPALQDGMNDEAHFGMEAAEVIILDVNGKQVFRAEAMDGATIAWPCRDEGGRLVPSGVYIARIQQKNGAITHQTLVVVK